MRILIDTNICLDILQKRPDFYENSKKALLHASEKNYKLYLTSVSVMDQCYHTYVRAGDHRMGNRLLRTELL